MQTRSRFRTLALFALIVALATARVSAAPVVVTPVPGSKDAFYLNQLIVEIDPRLFGSTVDEFVAVVENSASSGAPTPALVSRLGSPVAAKPVMLNRSPRATGEAFAFEDPSYRLHNTLVLTYADDDTTARAQMILARDSAVKSQSRNTLVHYSTDPLVTIVSDPTKYQWGLYTINAIQPTNQVGVWAKTTGSAYVAMLDNGLKTAGGVHEDLAGNYRSQFSYNYGHLNDGPNGGSLSIDNLDETPFTGYNFAGHGTHTTGLVAAVNGNGLGGSGVCPTCSIMAGRVSQVYPYGGGWYIAPNVSYTTTGTADMALHGAQVINNSFGEHGAMCSSEPAWCASVGYADARDVVLVVASGNLQANVVDFPGDQPASFAVGGLSSSGQFWAGASGFGSNYTSSSIVQQFVAPASIVISSMYPNTDWHPDNPYNCGDNYPASFMVGYGDCAGTSMAAPHVTGIVGLMRSVDPLKTRKNIRDILIATTNTTLCSDANKAKCELGVPDATAAVTAALGGSNVANRTSPLFAFYSSTAKDHFYTYVPQMAMAALAQGGLRPQPASQPAVSYQGVGTAIAQYSQYPTSTCSPTPCSNTPTAIAVVHTTSVNPAGGAQLVPLYRLSYKCGDEFLTTPPRSQNPACVSNPSHLSHVYVTDQTSVTAFTGYNLNGVLIGQGLGYRLDGIEGYVYPTTLPRPSGTVKLCRKYDSTRDDYVLFTGGGPTGLDCSATTDGYTGGNYNQLVSGTDWIGWAYTAGTSFGAIPSNSPPIVNVTQPLNGATFAAGTNVTIAASASDPDPSGSVASVRFFVDQQLVGTTTVPPYQVTWSATNGAHTLAAVAVDNRGAVTSSTAVNITVGTTPTILNSGFETPSLGAGNYQYNPGGGSWSFSPQSGNGGSGISANGSGFTFLNPNAPEGAQVAFIQGTTAIAQTVNFVGTGIYHLQFKAAQRYGNDHFLQLQIQLDGGNIGSVIQPISTSYATYPSASFSILAAGNHTITFLGVNPYFDDNTIFIDAVAIVSP